MQNFLGRESLHHALILSKQRFQPMVCILPTRTDMAAKPGDSTAGEASPTAPAAGYRAEGT